MQHLEDGSFTPVHMYKLMHISMTRNGIQSLSTLCLFAKKTCKEINCN